MGFWYIYIYIYISRCLQNKWLWICCFKSSCVLNRGWHFFLESCGMGKQNRYELRDWDGRGEFNREWAGPEIVMIHNFTHKYTFYINKLYILILNSILVALSLYALLLFALVWLVKWMRQCVMDRLLTAGLCGNTLGHDIQTLTYHSSTSNMAFHLKDVCSSNFTWPLNMMLT